MVMLDEAFAGVDDDSRVKCLGLLATFDLDLVMTSEREWACYPTVPGIAIRHLGILVVSRLHSNPRRASVSLVWPFEVPTRVPEFVSISVSSGVVATSEPGALGGDDHGVWRFKIRGRLGSDVTEGFRQVFGHRNSA